MPTIDDNGRRVRVPKSQPNGFKKAYGKDIFGKDKWPYKPSGPSRSNTYNYSGGAYQNSSGGQSRPPAKSSTPRKRGEVGYPGSTHQSGSNGKNSYSGGAYQNSSGGQSRPPAKSSNRNGRTGYPGSTNQPKSSSSKNFKPRMPSARGVPRFPRPWDSKDDKKKKSNSQYGGGAYQNSGGGTTRPPGTSPESKNTSLTYQSGAANYRLGRSTTYDPAKPWHATGNRGSKNGLKAAAKRRSEGKSSVYVVKGGDSWGSIASRTGMSVKDLQKANSWQMNNRGGKLYRNSKVRIPGQ